MPIPTSIYQPFKIPAPTGGMNMNVDDDVLPSSYAASLVNFFPDPLGSIFLRNGTSLNRMASFGSSVLNIIPYVLNDGSEVLFYVATNPVSIDGYSNLVQPPDEGLPDNNTITFTFNAGDNSSYLVAGNSMRFSSGNGNFDRQIVSAMSDEDNNWQITFDLSVSVADIGSITGLNFYKAILMRSTGNDNDTNLYEFNPVYKMRGFSCLNRILFCTGADPIQVYDEESDSVSPLSQIVTVKIVQNQDGSFSLDRQQGPAVPSYQLNPHVQAVQNGTTYLFSNATETQFNLQDENGVSPQVGSIEFVIYPPYSAFCTMIAGRLWFLGEGGISKSFKSTPEAMKASYSYNLNTLNSFTSNVTGLTPYIDLSAIDNAPDSLERIEEFSGYLVFFGKKEIYLYNGLYPDAAGFSFYRSIPSGLYHSDLLQKIGRDIIFMSAGRLCKLGTEDVLAKVALQDINGLDPYIRDAQQRASSSDYLYSSCAFHEQTKQIMMKIDSTASIVLSIVNQSYAPYLYAGDFSLCQSFVTGRDVVYLALPGKKILQYQEISQSISDAVSGDISFSWRSPSSSFLEKTFATRKLLINLEADPEFALGIGTNSSEISLQIDGVSGLTGKNIMFARDITIDSFGDILQGFSVRRSNEYGIMHGVQWLQSLNLVLSKLSILLSGRSSAGRIKIKNLILLGVSSHG